MCGSGARWPEKPHQSLRRRQDGCLWCRVVPHGRTGIDTPGFREQCHAHTTCAGRRVTGSADLGTDTTVRHVCHARLHWPRLRWQCSDRRHALLLRVGRHHHRAGKAVPGKRDGKHQKHGTDKSSDPHTQTFHYQRAICKKFCDQYDRQDAVAIYRRRGKPLNPLCRAVARCFRQFREYPDRRDARSGGAISRKSCVSWPAKVHFYANFCPVLFNLYLETRHLHTIRRQAWTVHRARFRGG